MSSLDKHVYETAPAKGAPVIFAFHGTGGDETQFSGLIPDVLPGAGIVAPRGDVSEHGANRFFRRTGEGVYDMEDLATRTQAMIAFVRARMAAHPDVPAYALGYSNGANILAAMSFVAPDLFARIALLHPLIPWTPEPVAGLAARKVLITGGRRDQICPLPLTEALAGFYSAQGADLTISLHDGGHELRPNEVSALKGFFA
ncbi:alpha/beta hydrolase [Pseudooceanicola sediminis]|uniref:Alpha/beta hydrolase n=1 Tax=Pseudooceanicola sediminis TaxID=2211117 RepID=A0A399IV67_9RHOB|nr:alpha/beta hydrolase [Pseudooceanicola sediminis]KAA2314916.1 alpha/beta hydrolase [Puniceibacterium sp. HSS470]RII36941.1 alpha/beta hydrolase [Pseudooceanicola sediminis]|tara:strand:- start:13803 stop:14405 length:603 start_codon:yes stop_codon:yes gene_type:complete